MVIIRAWTLSVCNHWDHGGDAKSSADRRKYSNHGCLPRASQLSPQAACAANNLQLIGHNHIFCVVVIDVAQTFRWKLLY
jgi:hypothetical protein